MPADPHASRGGATAVEPKLHNGHVWVPTKRSVGYTLGRMNIGNDALQNVLHRVYW